MVAPINSHNNSISHLSDIRRINLVEPQQATTEGRRNALIESNQLRRQYIGGLENYILANRELQNSNNRLIQSNNELIQLHKEQRQLLQESRDLYKESRDLTQKQIDVTKSLIADLQEIKHSRREAVMSLFDKKSSIVSKTEESIKPSSKTISASTLTKEERIAARKEQASKQTSTSKIETKPATTGKVFEYIPKVSLEALKQDTSIIYKPTSAQVSSNIERSRANNEPKFEELKVPVLNASMRQMVYYSQKNLWESIITASVSDKLV